MYVIDIDSHSRPRPEDYDISSEYAHLKPRSYRDMRGNVRIVFDNKIVTQLSGGELKKSEEVGKAAWRAGNYDGALRYEQVRAAGVDYQFVSCGTVGEFNYIDPQVGAAFIRGYNDFLYQRFIKPYPDTFTGVPQLPLQDTRLALNELERCVKDLGMRSFLMPTNWNGIDLADPYWWNFWDGVRELGITGIIDHIGSLAGPWVGKERLAVLGSEGTTGRRIVSQPFEYCVNICNLIFGGMMDSFPEFRFAFLEAGAEFAIVLKHRIAENLEQIAYLQEQMAHPLEWYFDRFYFLVDDVLLEEPKRLELAIEELGEDHLFFGSDYPHTDGHLDIVDKVQGLPLLSEAQKAKILGGNANALFGGTLTPDKAAVPA